MNSASATITDTPITPLSAEDEVEIRLDYHGIVRVLVPGMVVSIPLLGVSRARAVTIQRYFTVAAAAQNKVVQTRSRDYYLHITLPLTAQDMQEAGNADGKEDHNEGGV